MLLQAERYDCEASIYTLVSDRTPISRLTKAITDISSVPRSSCDRVNVPTIEVAELLAPSQVTFNHRQRQVQD